MKTISVYGPTSVFLTASRDWHLPAAWRTAFEHAAAIAVLALATVVVFFMAIGVSAFVLELAQALILVGPISLTGLVLTAAVWRMARR